MKVTDLGNEKTGAVNSERAKGSGNKRWAQWAGFSSYQITAYLVRERERKREREEMSLELSHHKTEVCRFIWALAYVKQRRYAVRTRPR